MNARDFKFDKRASRYDKGFEGRFSRRFYAALLSQVKLKKGAAVLDVGYTTNYVDTFIEVAEDCPATAAQAPPVRDHKTAAGIEYEMLINNPYQYTSDDVLYESNGRRRGISWEDFSSKGQPCFRSSALTKRYGWGIYSDKKGKIAIYAVGSADYKRLSADETIRHVKAMRSGKIRE